MAANHDLVSVLVTDHREVEHMFTELERDGLAPPGVATSRTT